MLFYFCGDMFFIFCLFLYNCISPIFIIKFITLLFGNVQNNKKFRNNIQIFSKIDIQQTINVKLKYILCYFIRSRGRLGVQKLNTYRRK